MGARELVALKASAKWVLEAIWGTCWFWLQAESLKRHVQGDFWMVELSVPELFSTNRRKLGEVLLVSDTAPGVQRDFRNYVLARVPGYFAFHTGGDLLNPQFSFVPSGITGHVPLCGCEQM